MEAISQIHNNAGTYVTGRFAEEGMAWKIFDGKIAGKQNNRGSESPWMEHDWERHSSRVRASRWAGSVCTQSARSLDGSPRGVVTDNRRSFGSVFDPTCPLA